MRTAGIDLASQPENTATCVVAWADGAATITRIAAVCDDDLLLDAIAAADHTGIDAPFGWPDEFVRAVSEHHRLGRWPAGSNRTPLALRQTDRVVAERVGRQPLSVSTDKLAFPAMRCAHLLDRLPERSIVVDRAGTGRVAEVYPAAALKQWGMNSRGYKGPAGERARRTLVTQIARQCAGLRLDASHRRALIASDHVLDAFIAALVARAVPIGETVPPSPDQLELARLEGWIHVPARGSLARLAHRDPP